MRQLLLTTAFVLLAAPVHCQNVSVTNTCSKAPTYDKGINLVVHVITNESLSDRVLESAIAKDISRFKDTNEVKTSGGPVVPIKDRTIGFDATVFWSEIKMTDGSISAYVASYFVIETCAVFDNGSGVSGFSTHVLLISGPHIQPQRDKLLDEIEKQMYDQILKDVNKRRA